MWNIANTLILPEQTLSGNMRDNVEALTLRREDSCKKLAEKYFAKGRDDKKNKLDIIELRLVEVRYCSYPTFRTYVFQNTRQILRSKSKRLFMRNVGYALASCSYFKTTAFTFIFY